jgi:ribose transport system ATP-binding protein
VSEVRLYAHNLDISYGTLPDAYNVSFVLRSGESIALVGYGRAGHRTVIDFLKGGARRIGGTLLINGSRIEGDSLADTAADSLFCVPMMPEGEFSVSLLEELFLLRTDSPDRGIWNERRAEIRARVLLCYVGLQRSLRTRVDALSPLEFILLEFAKALDLSANVILLDENLARLSEPDMCELERVVNKMKSTGISFVLCSDSPQKRYLLADTILLFRDGMIMKKVLSSAYTDEVGALCLAETRHDAPLVRSSFSSPSSVSFFVSDLPLSDECPSSFEIRGGEVLNVASYNASFRKSFFALLTGDAQDRSFSVSLDGRPVRPLSVSRLVKRKIVLMRWNRGGASLSVNLSVADNLILPSLRKILRFGMFHQGVAGEAARRHLLLRDGELPVRTEDCSLQQRIEIALERWIVFRPRVVIMLDPFEYAESGDNVIITEYIERFAANGAAVLLITSGNLAYRGSYATDFRDSGEV